MSSLRFIKRKDIDITRWDELINLSGNSLPYGYSWYLDAVAENWDALVAGDYEALLPLVWLRKLGIKCLYQPYYCQQLDILSRQPVPVNTAEEFLLYVRKSFSYVDMNISAAAVQTLAEEFKLRRKLNLVLPLNREYAQIRKNYSENHTRNIRKAEKNGWLLAETTDLKALQQFYLKNINRERENFKEKHERLFLLLTNELIERNKGKMFTVIDNAGRVIAATLLIFHQKRMINIVNSSSDEGKSGGAAHFLFDEIIKKYSTGDNVLDFEGSSVATVARFYKGFGAEEEFFFNYKKEFFKL